MGNQNSRKKNTYKVPPGAGKPDPPAKPTVEYIGDDVMVRWNEPRNNGGCPIIGYVLQFNRVDGDLWESYRVDGTECLLRNLDDTFVFRVVAENLVGYSEPSETSVPVSFEFSEPVLLVPLNNVTRAIEFEKVELNCRVWGVPNPELTWYLNGEEIIPTNRIFMNTDGIDYKVVFNHIKISDEGEIKAMARNLLGEVESSGSIVVEAPPRIKAPKHYDEGVICRVGETMRLKFGCHGRPKPEVSWYHNGEPLRRAFKPQEIGDVAVLTLDNMTRDDAGEYTIRVENNIGEDVAHVLVTVIDRPLPPGKPTVIQLPDNSCVLEWDTANNEDVTTYIVEYFRDGWGVWLKALSTRSRNCKIRDLIPGSKYRFRIKAENHFGASDGGEESVQIYIPESNKEHGNIMSSIQEDDFEIVPESNEDFDKQEQLVPPPIPGTPKPNSDKRHLGHIRGGPEQSSKYESSTPPKSPTRSRVSSSTSSSSPSGFPEVSLAQSKSQPYRSPYMPKTENQAASPDTTEEQINRSTWGQVDKADDKTNSRKHTEAWINKSTNETMTIKRTEPSTLSRREEPRSSSKELGRRRPWDPEPTKTSTDEPATKKLYSRRELIKSDRWDRTSPERLERPSSAPPTEQPQPGDDDRHSVYRRNQIIGSGGNSRSNDTLHSLSSGSGGGSRYYDHYGSAGRTTRGADRFAKYRQQQDAGKASPSSNINNNRTSSSHSLNRGSQPGSCEELEQSSKDGGSFVIVEDADDDEEEESADCVVSQLIVPVKSGSVKISTSFDNGNGASVKSSMDDLSFDLSRNQTPDLLTNNSRHFLHYRSRDDMSSLSRESSRSNLLQSLAEFTDGKLSSESKENLEENPFYQEATRRKVVAASVSKSTPSESLRKQQQKLELQQHRRGDVWERRNVSEAAAAAMNEDDASADDANNELFRKSGGSDVGGGTKVGRTDDAKNTSSASEHQQAGSLKDRLKGLLDTTTVLLFFTLLGPLLLRNVYTFTLFCLLLIKMTFM